MFGKRTLRFLRCALIIAGFSIAGGEAWAAAPAEQQATGSSSVKSSTLKKKTSRSSRRAAQSQRALREAATPRYRVDSQTGSLVPDPRAAAAIIYEPHTGHFNCVPLGFDGCEGLSRGSNAWYKSHSFS